MVEPGSTCKSRLIQSLYFCTHPIAFVEYPKQWGWQVGRIIPGAQFTESWGWCLLLLCIYNLLEGEQHGISPIILMFFFFPMWQFSPIFLILLNSVWTRFITPGSYTHPSHLSWWFYSCSPLPLHAPTHASHLLLSFCSQCKPFSLLCHALVQHLAFLPTAHMCCLLFSHSPRHHSIWQSSSLHLHFIGTCIVHLVSCLHAILTLPSTSLFLPACCFATFVLSFVHIHCYRYLKWLGIALSLFLRLLVLFHFGSMPLKRALMLFPSKRFLPQSHACSTLSFRYTRVTYVTCLFILVVCGTCNLYLLPPPWFVWNQRLTRLLVSNSINRSP